MGGPAIYGPESALPILHEISLGGGYSIIRRADTFRGGLER